MGNVCCKCLRCGNNRENSIVPIGSAKDESTARKRLNLDDSVLDSFNKDDRHVKFDSSTNRQLFGDNQEKSPKLKQKLNRMNYSDVFADVTPHKTMYVRKPSSKQISFDKDNKNKMMNTATDLCVFRNSHNKNVVLNPDEKKTIC